MPERTTVNLDDYYVEDKKFCKVYVFGCGQILGGFEGFTVFETIDAFWLLKAPDNWLHNRTSQYERVMKLSLEPQGNNCWYVDYSYLCKKYRGKDLSWKFYRYLVLNHNMIIISGSAQSKGGESIWKRSSNCDDITVKLTRFNTKFSPIKNIKYKQAEKSWDFDKPKMLKSDNFVFKAEKKKKRGRPRKIEYAIAA